MCCGKLCAQVLCLMLPCRQKALQPGRRCTARLSPNHKPLLRNFALRIKLTEALHLRVLLQLLSCNG